VAHIYYNFPILPYLCWRAWGHKITGPRWSQELFVLIEFLHGTAWQMWEAMTQIWHVSLVNFQHQPSRTFLPSISNHTCCCEVNHGSHSDKGQGSKAVASEAEVCPPVRVVHLALLSAFWFPWTAVVSHFWSPWQYMTTSYLEAHIPFSNSTISCSYLTLFPSELMNPLSLYRAP
jgi:hypothetical protein